MAVIPSLYEPFGIVALEVMAAKTPVVVSDVGGLSELINDDEGVKVPPGNSESLAEGIVKILSAEDERRIEVDEMVEKGFKKALSLRWDNASEATIRVYVDALGPTRASIAIPAQKEDVKLDIGSEKGENWKYSYS